MAFCIVSFQKEGQDQEVAVIHKNWIFDDACYWPPFWKNATKLTAAIKMGTRPDFSNWSMHSIHIVAGKYYGKTFYNTTANSINFCVVDK